ncbi:MAG: hypothetical protein DWQ37_00545 [Planctomycetota bacterium]|nr:MAG: hypothetical protein DWQ37_00545 [Planctomycetota bacterium]
MRCSTVTCLAGAAVCLCAALAVENASAQVFRYAAKPRAGNAALNFADSDAPPLPLSDAASPAGWPGGGNLLTANAESIPPGESVDPFGSDWPPAVPGQEYRTQDTYDTYDITPDAPIEPELTGEPFLQPVPQSAGPGACTAASCGAPCTCRRCYLRHWGSNFRHVARSGAFGENFTLFTGKQGFKGPVDLGVNGNFGFHGGGNWGMPFIDVWGLGYQIGADFIVSDFEGRSGPLGHRRTQLFATTGLFRRAAGERGLQGGCVVDYLRDDFYIQMDLVQVRAEASYFYHGHDIGFWGAFHTNTTTHVGSTPITGQQTFSYQTVDQYNLFYRYQFCNGTFCRTWFGLSGFGDGIFGSDATVRVSERIGLLATYNYLLPKGDQGVPKNVEESWNLTISLVWYPGYKRRDSWVNPYRPLFYVADNGWMMTRQAN